MKREMNIELNYIKDSGNIDKERIVFNVISDTELGKFLVAQTELLEDSRFSSKLGNIYWFPDQQVKAGDLVVLYTKVGINTSIQNENSTTTYFYYWGLDTVHNQNINACIVILDASWKSYAVPVNQ